MLWHGGFRSPAQVAFAAVAAIGLLLCGGAWRLGALMLGLTLSAVAMTASGAWHHDTASIAPVMAAIALPVLVAVAIRAGPSSKLVSDLPLVVALLGATAATTGLAGLVLRAPPLAERIAGVWRAQGTLEYPPALGLVCVCALAAMLALHAQGTIDRPSAIALGGLLAGTAVATFDRVAWIETATVLALFAGRVIAVRRTVALVVGVSIGCALVAIAISHPSRAALERHLRHGPVSSRGHVWHAAGDAFIERPVIGYGPGQFRAIYDAPDPTARIGLAHNAVLEQAVEGGVIAAAGSALALLAMLAAGVRSLASREPARLSAAVAASAIALSGLYDITWSFPPLLLLGAISAVACRTASASTRLGV